MQVSHPNDVKIYNLSAGKSVPEWLTEKKKKSLLKSDVDIRRRIELLQDFEMPTCSTSVRVTKDGRYILAAGTYKPRVRCYEVNQMSMKFDRCMDADIVNFLILSEDYSKMVFLQNDRYIEIHTQQGRYDRFRIPTFGRDLAYLPSSAELYFVGTGSKIYRFSLEKGRFVKPFVTNAKDINCCEFNKFHEFLLCGTNEGQVECWDPRKDKSAAILDCAPHIATDGKELPSITTVKYRNAFQFAVGTSTGQVLLYDLRSSKPLLIKDHNFGLPIRGIEFHPTENLILSCDTRILKIWNRDTGASFTSIEPETPINGLCVVPDSGLLFLANEAPKILSYYIPDLGAAPRWASFLDSMTEELEESNAQVYDDYKFVTRTELDALGLSNYIGTNVLRAFMHGFYIDMQLYRKTKALSEPFVYSEFRKKRIEEQRAVESRVKVQKLPQVNRRLAEKLMEDEAADANKKTKAKKQEASNLLGDKRFQGMFADSVFQVDERTDEYLMLNPLLTKLDRERKKRREQEVKAMDEDKESEDEDDERSSEDDDGSSDDDHTFKAEVKEQMKKRSQAKYDKQKAENLKLKLESQAMNIKYFEGDGKTVSGSGVVKKIKRLDSKKSLGERVKDEDDGCITMTGSTFGNIEMSYKVEPKKHPAVSQRDAENRKHLQERRKAKRTTSSIEVPKYQRGGMFSKRGRR